MNTLFFLLLFIAVIKTGFGQFDDALKLSLNLLKEDTSLRKSYIMSRSQYNNGLPSSYKKLSIDLYSQYVNNVKQSLSALDSLSAFNQDTLIINNISYHRRFGTLKSYDGHLTFTLSNKDSSITTNVYFIYFLNTSRYFVKDIRVQKAIHYPPLGKIKLIKIKNKTLKDLKVHKSKGQPIDKNEKSEDVFKQIEKKLKTKKAQPE